MNNKDLIQRAIDMHEQSIDLRDNPIWSKAQQEVKLLLELAKAVYTDRGLLIDEEYDDIITCLITYLEYLKEQEKGSE